MAEEDGAQPGWSGPADEVYANVVSVSGGPFDVTLVFGQQDNPGRSFASNKSEPPTAEVVRVSMSWGHLKSMVPLLARLVAAYEQEVGQIPSPGFEQNWKA